MNLQTFRSSFGISQSKLARLSGVSRFKLCTFELGHGRLDQNEQELVRKAFQLEARRVQGLVSGFDPSKLTFDTYTDGPTTNDLMEEQR